MVTVHPLSVFGTCDPVAHPDERDCLGVAAALLRELWGWR